MIVAFVIGLLCGIIGTVLVVRNNKSAAQNVITKL